MRELRISLPDECFDLLRRDAGKNLRQPYQQASWLIREALRALYGEPNPYGPRGE